MSAMCEDAESAVTLFRVRAARKERMCADCGTPITVGQSYVILSCPPGGDPSAPDAGWQSMSAHHPYDCVWGAP